MLQVHWLEQRFADVPGQNDWLSLAEVSCLNRLRFPKRQADWRLGRWTAKRALAKYLKLPSCHPGLAAIEIRPAPSGAPDAFVAGKPAEAAISLSHRAAIACCAVAPPSTDIGCDLELMEPHSEWFIADYLTSEEQELVARAQGPERVRLVALLWSGKESALKALRTGLRLDTRSAVVCPQCEGGDGWRPLVVRTAGRLFAGWWEPAGDLVRTVVAAPASPPPLFLDISSAS